MLKKETRHHLASVCQLPHGNERAGNTAWHPTLTEHLCYFVAVGKNPVPINKTRNAPKHLQINAAKLQLGRWGGKCVQLQSMNSQ